MTTTTSLATEYLLIVDDEPGVRQTMARGLWDAGYQCATAGDGQEALKRLKQGRYALMLCDIRMPGMDGIELLDQALKIDPDMIVVMVTALAGLQTALTAIRIGAYDYLTKPFQLAELELVVRRALHHYRLTQENRRYTLHLEEMVEVRTKRLHDIALSVITSLGLTLEAKDEYTHDHSRRVSELAARLAQRLGAPADECANLRLAGLLLDIGKIGVREDVLHKAGPLTPAELRHVRLHPDIGARILSPLKELERIIPSIRHHHERWDGTGYPDGLRGETIPYGARILAVADAYVAMREPRAYRLPMHRHQVLDDLRIGAQRQFDLDVVYALLALDQEKLLDQLDQEFPQDLPDLHMP